jgi:hypothetical protein
MGRDGAKMNARCDPIPTRTRHQFEKAEKPKNIEKTNEKSMILGGRGVDFRIKI